MNYFPSEIRTRLQTEAIEKLINGHRLLVNWGTGVGKSRVAIGSIERLIKSGKHRILLLVAERAHKLNWLNEFKDAKGEAEGARLFSMLKVECYQSLQKFTGSEWDLIVADEAHHLRSDNRIAILDSIWTDYFLCLSATMSCNGDADTLIKMMNLRFGKFEVIKLGVREAVSQNILQKPKIYVHVLPLNQMTERVPITIEYGRKNQRIEVECLFEERESVFKSYHSAKMTAFALPKDGYNYYNRKVNDHFTEWKKQRGYQHLEEEAPDNFITKRFYNKYLRSTIDRKEFLGRCKTEFTKALLRHISNKKYICFCSTVQQAIELGGNNAIYAENPDSAKVIEMFNNEQISSIFAVNMLQEGQNLKGIKAGVIIQLGSKNRVFLQKFGRALRSDEPEQHLIIINGTVDVDYFTKSLNEILVDKTDWTQKDVEDYVEYIRYGKEEPTIETSIESRFTQNGNGSRQRFKGLR